jgi:hypothetical protein
MNPQDSNPCLGTLREGQLLDFLREQTSESLRVLLKDEAELLRRLCDYTSERLEEYECDSEQASEGAAIYESRLAGAGGIWRRLSASERDQLVELVLARFRAPDVNRRDLDMILC